LINPWGNHDETTIVEIGMIVANAQLWQKIMNCQTLYSRREGFFSIPQFRVENAPSAESELIDRDIPMKTVLSQQRSISTIRSNRNHLIRK
jgi:hypothetical protein